MNPIHEDLLAARNALAEYERCLLIAYTTHDQGIALALEYLLESATHHRETLANLQQLAATSATPARRPC